jgi:hypothetical protein
MSGMNKQDLRPNTIEIERMVAKLQQLGESFGGSLDKGFLD